MHHHHHHHPGRTLVAGAAIGAAMASRRSQQQQPQVVVVQQAPPVAGYGYTTTSAGPGYQSTTTTTMYATQPPPTATIVQPKQQSTRRRPAAACVVCAFLVAIVLCASLIPWPGMFSRTVLAGSQQLDYVDGNFVEQVRFTGTINASPKLYAFRHRPLLTATRYFTQTLSFRPSYYNPSSVYYDLVFLSRVSFSWTYTDSCPLELLVIRSTSRYNSFLNGGYVTSSIYPISITGNSTGGSFTADFTDTYYFVVNNPNTNCQPAVSGLATFNVEAVAFDTSNPDYTCSDGNCVDYVPYGYGRFYVLEAPVPAATEYGQTYSGEYQTFGRWYSYVGLYCGLFVGMCVCALLATRMGKKRGGAAGDDDAAEAPLLRPADPAYVTTTSYQTNTATSSTMPPDAYAVPVDNPPPYAYKYDPQTGQPIAQ